MPQSKDPLMYPTEYYELMSRAMVETLTIPFPTVNKARNFQMRLGGFRAALMHNPGDSATLALGSRGIAIAREENVVILRPKQCEQAVLNVLRGTNHEQP